MGAQLSRSRSNDKERTREKEPLRERDRDRDRDRERDSNDSYDRSERRSVRTLNDDGTSYLDIEFAGYGNGRDYNHEPQQLYAEDSTFSNAKRSAVECQTFGGGTAISRSLMSRKRNTDLFGKVSLFEYQLPDNDILLSAKYLTPIFSKTVIDNKGQSAIKHCVTYSEESLQSYEFDFEEKLIDCFDSLDIDRKIPFVIEFNGKTYRFDVKSASVYECNKRCQTFRSYNCVSISKEINIPEDSVVEIEANMEKIDNVLIPFTAQLEISRRKANKVFSGEAVKKYLRKLNLPIASVNENSITMQTKGTLRLGFNIETKFSVKNS